MKNDKLASLYAKYDLSEDEIFQHQHYKIITRAGIDKIQAIEKIYIDFEAVKVEPNFCVVKATAEKGEVKIQTFGSAKHGKQNEGNTISWYVMEMAEKRAMSRAVLKLTGFYELGVFGEDESEDFKKQPPQVSQQVEPPQRKLTQDQIEKIPTSDNLDTLQTVLRNFTLTPDQKQAIELRIQQLI